jgi:hypothetical protein
MAFVLSIMIANDHSIPVRLRVSECHEEKCAVGCLHVSPELEVQRQCALDRIPLSTSKLYFSTLSKALHSQSVFFDRHARIFEHR